jgi:hypothetical protein
VDEGSDGMEDGHDDIRHSRADKTPGGLPADQTRRKGLEDGEGQGFLPSRTHASEMILHDATARALRRLRTDDGKVASLSTLKAEHAKLTERRDTLKAEYAELRKQAHEYGVIKRNVDSILNVKDGKTKRKERSKALQCNCLMQFQRQHFNFCCFALRSLYYF